MNKILRIAHRGASGYEPENSLQAFQKAIDLGVDGVELDVHLSANNQLVVIHDETIDRTTNKKGEVQNYTAIQLKALDIPTLTEVLDLVNKQCLINIELKGVGTAKPTANIIEQYVKQKNWKYSDFIISSFDWKMLDETQVLNPNIQIGVLTEETIDEALAFAKKIKAYSIHPDYLLLTKENVALLQENGFEVLRWTVNTAEAIQKIKSFRVNGIISNFPDRI